LYAHMNNKRKMKKKIKKKKKCFVKFQNFKCIQRTPKVYRQDKKE
jgi:hypothetical protein